MFVSNFFLESETPLIGLKKFLICDVLATLVVLSSFFLRFRSHRLVFFI